MITCINFFYPNLINMAGAFGKKILESFTVTHPYNTHLTVTLSERMLFAR